MIIKKRSPAKLLSNVSQGERGGRMTSGNTDGLGLGCATMRRKVGRGNACRRGCEGGEEDLTLSRGWGLGKLEAGNQKQAQGEGFRKRC